MRDMSKISNVLMQTLGKGANDMAQIYNIISIVAFSLAGVCLAFAVFCWIRFKIPKIIGALSGRTAKKSIEQMRSGNDKKSFNPISVATERKTLTKTIGQNTKTNRPSTASQKNQNETELLNYGGGETEILDVGTERLSQNLGNNTVSQNVELFESVQDVVYLHTDEVVV